LANHTRATLLGAQDRQRPQQTAEEPAAEGQAVITGHLDGETSKDAEAAFDAFIAAYELKYDKAAECLAKDRQALLAFYDFPAEHWKHMPSQSHSMK
jgi:transposase-like protein